MIAIDFPKEQLRDFCRKWKITEFALFGSVTRPEEFREDSGVHVLVRWAEDAQWSLSRVPACRGRNENPYRKRSILESVVQLDVA